MKTENKIVKSKELLGRCCLFIIKVCDYLWYSEKFICNCFLGCIKMRSVVIVLILFCLCDVGYTRFTYLGGHKVVYGCYYKQCWSYCGLSWVGELFNVYFQEISNRKFIKNFVWFRLAVHGAISKGPTVDWVAHMLKIVITT